MLSFIFKILNVLRSNMKYQEHVLEEVEITM